MKIYEKESKIRYLEDLIDAIKDDELEYFWIKHERDVDRIEIDENGFPQVIYGDNYTIKIDMKYDQNN